MCFVIEFTPQEPRLGTGGVRLRIDLEALHEREVDDQSAFADSGTQDVVSTPTHIHEEVMGAGESGYHYYLTEAGEALRPVIEALAMWGYRFARSHLAPRDLDPGLLMWDIRRWLRMEYLPPGRIVIRFEFPDQPADKRCWWLLNDREDLDLCLHDPGFDVDLTVSADLHTMTRLWLGDLAIADALRMHTLTLAGSMVPRLNFHDWIGLSPFVHMQERAPPPGT
jgi:hypothetical protein